ncbi:MAG: hypothetical protein IT204_15060 [Fimbriimonadaceae bacterium]|nr:hypothetical protein [Fimbriimonadaceae bacterium]
MVASWLLCLALQASPVFLLSDFESALPVRLGGEHLQPGVSAALQTQVARSGRQAVGLHYAFASGVPSPQYVGFSAPLTIPLRAAALRLAVRGDGSGQRLNLRLADRSGEVHQFVLGLLTFRGWRELRVGLGDGGLCWGGDQNRRLDPPLRLDLLLVDSVVRPASGDLYFDDLRWEPRVEPAPPEAAPLPLAAARLAGDQLQPATRLAWQAADETLQLDYTFTAAAGLQFVALELGAALPPGERLLLELEGDGGGALLRAQVQDASGETHQFTLGGVNWTGWQRAELPLSGAECWGGDGNRQLDGERRLRALICDRPGPGTGRWRLRRLAVVPSHGRPQPLELVSEPAETAPPGLGGTALQAGSRLLLDRPEHLTGAASWRCDYEFAQVPGLQYLEVPLGAALGTGRGPVRMQVKGDGSANPLRVRVHDASGEYHQYDCGTLQSTAWRELRCPLDRPSAGHWGGDGNGQLDGALTLVSVLVDAAVRPSQGRWWVDQVTIEQLAPAAQAVQCTVEPATPSGWTTAGAQPLGLQLTWRDRRAGAAGETPLAVRLVALDAAGEQVQESLRTVTLPGGQPVTTTWRWEGAAPGWRTLALVWRLADDYAVQRVNLARLPAAAAGPQTGNPFGACLHYAQHKGRVPLNYQLLARCGARWSRDEYGWTTVERERGKYTFPEYNDHYLRQARAQGIEPLIILDYGNPLYDDGQAPTSEPAQTAFAEYAYQMVRRYKDVCSAWEVYNEPNIGFWKPKPDPIAYTRLLQKTYQACKRADPTCTVVGICTAGTDLQYIEAVLQAGGGPYMDALSVHPYRYPRSPEESDFVGELQRLQALMQRYGIGDKPVWLTEIGWPNQDDPRGVSEATTADYLVRMVCLARALPFVGPVIWYDFQNDGTNPAYNEDNFGLLNLDFSPKRPYLAAAMMNRVLAAPRFAADHSPGDGLHGQEYVGADGERTVVLWSSTAPREVTLTLAGAANVELSSGSGEQRQVALQEGRLQVAVSGTPVFVTGRCTAVTVTPPVLLTAAAPTWPGGLATLELRAGPGAAGPAVAAPTAVWEVPPGWPTPQPVGAIAGAGGPRGQRLEVRVPADAAPGEYDVLVRLGAAVTTTAVTVEAPLAVRLVPQWQQGRLVTAVAAQNQTSVPQAGWRVQVLGEVVALPTLAPGATAVSASGAAVPGTAGVVQELAVTVEGPAGLRWTTAATVNGWLVPRLPAITVDGDLREWAQVTPVALTDYQSIAGRRPADDADLAATVRLAWSPTALGLAAEVRDAQHVQQQAPETAWQDDSLQVAVDPLAGSEPAAGFTEVALALGAAALGERTLPTATALPAGSFAVRRAGAVTTYEAALPWALLGVSEPRAGRRLGFGALVNENDGTGREGWLQVFGGIGWTKRAAELGVVVLGG